MNDWLRWFKPKNAIDFGRFNIYEQVEQEKSFITSGPCLQDYLTETTQVQ